MSETPNLALPVMEAGQAQKHVTFNEALARLDGLAQICAVSATVTAQPGAPAEGAVYILPAGKSGAAWSTMATGALAQFSAGVWEQITPREGWLAYVRDSDLLLHFTGAAWAGLPATKALTLSASDRLVGRVSFGGGAAEEVVFTDQAQALCDDASFAAMRATLGEAWTSFTPTVTAGSGAIGAQAGASGRYIAWGKTIHVTGAVTITTNGTAGLGIVFTLPVAGSGGVHYGIGRHSGGGALISHVFSGTHLVLNLLDGTHPGADGRSLSFSATYEAA